MMARRQAGSEKAIIHNGWWPFHFLRALSDKLQFVAAC
jgi:hypothetical protein